MHYRQLQYPGATAELAVFPDGRHEIHAIIRTTLRGASFAEQLMSVTSAAAALEAEHGQGRDTVFRRYFLSDATNQAPLLPTDDCAISIVQQPPLDGTKVALWLLLQKDGHGDDLGYGIRRDRHGIVWAGDVRENDCDISVATPHLLTVQYLENFSSRLSELGAGLKENCVRTWFFVRDVDVNYGGVVSGRNEMFNAAGLSRDTHFIASTGIEGRNPSPSIPVSFNAYADTRLSDRDMTFLKGASHLNPTIEYGVAFERGTAVDYADRRHVFISGTASIDNRGEIVAPGDIRRQTLRMLENIEVLLNEAECGFADVAHLIVYLRDTADYATVDEIFRREIDDRYGRIPRVMVLAPVCRPGWLIETECMAIRRIHRPERIPF
ncbi:MAG: hypothetical protein K2I48_01425 [Muribaculaceae bacterium]|nr:hypothetical protein [Muribaculaceae bacterium]